MLARRMIHDIWNRIKQANEQILAYDRDLYTGAGNPVAKRLTTIRRVTTSSHRYRGQRT